MNVVLKSSNRTLVSLSTEEWLGICNALNEVCHGVHIEDWEFSTRLGVSRDFLSGVLSDLGAEKLSPNQMADERKEVWTDGASVQLICVTAFGDPIDSSVEEAKEFANQILNCIEKAD